MLRTAFGTRYLFAVIGVSLATATIGFAQTPVELGTAQARYSLLKANVRPEGDLRREIDAIDAEIADAIRSQKTGEAMRLFAKGTVRLSGQPWTDVLDYSASVALHADRLFIDSTVPFTVKLEQFYPASLPLRAPLTAHVTLHRPPRPDATGDDARGPMLRDMGVLNGVAPDLRKSPFLFDLKLAGLDDGRYVIEVELLHDGTLIALRGLSIDVRKGLDARLADLDSRLGRVKTELAAKFGPDVRYPADVVRKVNQGLIDVGRFDLTREISAAEEVLRSLERGKDPFAGRTGEFKRHYLFADAGEIMPYHLYVPTGYGVRKPMPLIVALHGRGSDEDDLFAPGSLATLAEERHYLVVAPLGYRVDGRYGAGAASVQDPAVRRRRELSEADVLNVIDLVRTHYEVDADRIYLLGHSMGAGGAWYLGAKFPDRWAALACFAGTGNPDDEARLKQMPQLVVHGDQDSTVSLNASRAMVAQMKRLGIPHQYIEVAGGTHGGVVEQQLPAAFDFFDRYRRKRDPGSK